jgi:hypothetical protein
MLSDFGNALPEVRPDGSRSILTALGLEFLTESIDSSLVEMNCLLLSGISMARNAGEHKSGDRDQQVDQAAAELARATSVLMRAILQGIVTYLENGSMAPRRGSTSSGQLVPALETRVPTDATVAQIVILLRSCRLGPRFAIWVEQNWNELLKNPRLRAKPRLSGGSIPAQSARTPKVPIVTVRLPVSDPPTFASGVNLGAQAATLVAAAAQGTPFCPV